jgi:hypothetical protein
LYWYILYSATNTYAVIPWGLSISLVAQDGPVPADYDGDGKTDVAISREIFQPHGVFWWILQSRDGLRVERWGGDGTSRDEPVPADYDGDGKADMAIARSNSTSGAPYTWYIRRSTDGNWMTAQLGSFSFDRFAVGDYDGDGKADIAVVGMSSYNWRWISSSNGQFNFLHWGAHLDQFARGDYDGDGKTDQAIYRPNLNCSGLAYFWINGISSGVKVIPFDHCRGNPL